MSLLGTWQRMVLVELDVPLPRVNYLPMGTIENTGDRNDGWADLLAGKSLALRRAYGELSEGAARLFDVKQMRAGALRAHDGTGTEPTTQGKSLDAAIDRCRTPVRNTMSGITPANASPEDMWSFLQDAAHNF